MVAMTPSIMSALMISLTSRPKSSASSLTVTLGGSSTSVGYAATFFSFVCFFFLLWLKERAMREPPSFSLRLLSQSFFVFFLASFSALLVTGFCAVSSNGAWPAAAGRCGRAGRSVSGGHVSVILERSFLPFAATSVHFLLPAGGRRCGSNNRFSDRLSPESGFPRHGVPRSIISAFASSIASLAVSSSVTAPILRDASLAGRTGVLPPWPALPSALPSAELLPSEPASELLPALLLP